MVGEAVGNSLGDPPRLAVTRGVEKLHVLAELPLKSRPCDRPGWHAVKRDKLIA